MKTFKIIYKFGLSYGAVIFSIDEKLSYDEIIQKAIIETIAAKEKYFLLFENEREYNSHPMISILEVDPDTQRRIDGLAFRVPWN